MLKEICKQAGLPQVTDEHAPRTRAHLSSAVQATV